MPTPPPPEHSRWQAGQSGNPAGSSQKQRLTNTLHRMLDEKELDEAFIRVGLTAALKGDFRFWSYLFDRIDGKMSAGEGADGASHLAEILRGLVADRGDPDRPGDVPR